MWPERVVLDTSAYSRLKAGEEQLLEWLTRAAVVYLPVIVLGELEAGFRLGKRQAQNLRELAAFMDEPYVQPIPVTPEVARIYGEIFAALRRAGRPLPINDVWIAASTRAVNGHLLTFDTDFKFVPSLAGTVLKPRP